MASAPTEVGPSAQEQPRTLSFDIGGTGLKASVLAHHGQLLHEPVRAPTPYPLSPTQLVSALVRLAEGLPTYQRISAGFPGMVRDGHVLSAPHFVSPDGPGGKPSPKLEAAWRRFDLQGAIITGDGLELVVTLGTGVGTALFYKGHLSPHLELAHHPLSKGGKEYNEVLGDAARKKVGNKKWNARLASTLEILRELVFFDHCYIGGGNSRHVTLDLPPDVHLADNTAGILGGIKLWERM
jgi:polyphosphate glucokinase